AVAGAVKGLQAFYLVVELDPIYGNCAGVLCWHGISFLDTKGKRATHFGTPSFQTHFEAYSNCTFSACQPLGPLTTLNCTAWPSFRLRKPLAWIAEKWTKTSSPFSRQIKP